jgi:hydrogenase/urease accessory protein HupE
MIENRPPLFIAAAFVAIFAIFHGHAHGAELPPGASGLTYFIGFVIATGSLHAFGIGIGTIDRWSYGRLALRALGGAALYAGMVGKACARLAILLLPASWFMGNLLGGLSGAPSLAAPTWLFLL